MMVKRYIAKTTQEAMKKLRAELGPEAVILHTRRIKKPGFMGILKKSLVEIVAAIDEDRNDEDLIKTRGKRSYESQSQKIRKYNNSPRREPENNIADKDVEDSFNVSKNLNITNRQTINKDLFNKLDSSSNNNEKMDVSSNQEINKEIVKLRGTMEGFMKSFESKLYKNFYLPEKLRNYKEVMVSNGVNETVTNSILGNIDKNVNLDNKSDHEVKEIVRFNINGYLGNPSPIRYNGEQRIVFFIGPTGVGKTTTLAKLAAYYTIEKELEVGLVTADTYRIAAVEQLKTYSDILDIPIKIIYEKKDFYEVLSNFKDKDVVFVDTAGRSHKNGKQMEEVKDLLEMIREKEVYLVLSATTNLETIKEIIKQYDFVDNFKIIFTKIDEASDIGVILNAKFYTEMPLSYVTTGQNVPEDIEIVNITKLSSELIGETKNARSS